MLNQLSPVVYSNERILTTQQIADAYETDTLTIRRNFHNNKIKHFILGKHYFVLEGEELKNSKLTTSKI